jgi:predicted DNA-binding transcriptional regulator AlpA
VHYLAQLRVLKERLGRGLPMKPLRVGGHSVALDEAQVRAVIEERFVAQACIGLGSYLERIRAARDGRAVPVLLVGGSSRLEGLQEALEQRLGCTTVRWERSEYATVLGGVGLPADAAIGRRSGPMQEPPIEKTGPPADDLYRRVKEAKDKSEHVTALRALHQAAELGDAQAQFLLGEIYSHGRGGVSLDQAEAMRWYRKAAEQGHAAAQFRLGVIYADGRIVVTDYDRAAHWICKAAEQGYPDAQNELGVMYQKGRGLVKDDGKAVHWYRRAAEQGHVGAQIAAERQAAEQERQAEAARQAARRHGAG